MLTTWEEMDSKSFFNHVASMKFRDDDEKEARDFGCKNVLECFKKGIAPFSKYFIIRQADRTVCAILLRRDGNIVFFIEDNIEKPILLVRTLRRLAKRTVRCCGPIITKTASWYTEALRLNKLIGFKEYKLYNKFGLYVLDE